MGIPLLAPIKVDREEVELARDANESTSTLDTRMEDIRIEMALMRKRTARELQESPLIKNTIVANNLGQDP